MLRAMHIKTAFNQLKSEGFRFLYRGFCLHYVRKQYQCLSCLVCTTTISKYWILWCLTGIHTLRIQLQLLQLAWQRHCSLHLREFRWSSKIATTTRGSKIQHMPLLTFVNAALESTIEASRRYYCETTLATHFYLPCEIRLVCAWSRSLVRQTLARLFLRCHGKSLLFFDLCFSLLTHFYSFLW